MTDPQPPLPPRRGFSWAGASILVLSVCLGGGWATALIMSASARTPPIAGETGDLLNSIGGVLAGAIVAYVGGYISRQAREKADEAHTSDPKESSP